MELTAMRLTHMLLAGAIGLAPVMATPRVVVAQSTDRDAVLAVVQQVFDAMRTRDTSLLSRAFDSTAKLVGVSTRTGSPAVSLTLPSAFGAAITRAKPGDVWNERIYDPEVH